jgi:hypothetical protein
MRADGSCLYWENTASWASSADVIFVSNNIFENWWGGKEEKNEQVI